MPQDRFLDEVDAWLAQPPPPPAGAQSFLDEVDRFLALPSPEEQLQQEAYQRAQIPQPGFGLPKQVPLPPEPIPVPEPLPTPRRRLGRCTKR